MALPTRARRIDAVVGRLLKPNCNRRERCLALMDIQVSPTLLYAGQVSRIILSLRTARTSTHPRCSPCSPKSIFVINFTTTSTTIVLCSFRSTILANRKLSCEAPPYLNVFTFSVFVLGAYISCLCPAGGRAYVPWSKSKMYQALCGCDSSLL